MPRHLAGAHLAGQATLGSVLKRRGRRPRTAPGGPGVVADLVDLAVPGREPSARSVCCGRPQRPVGAAAAPGAPLTRWPSRGLGRIAAGRRPNLSCLLRDRPGPTAGGGARPRPPGPGRRGPVRSAVQSDLEWVWNVPCVRWRRITWRQRTRGLVEVEDPVPGPAQVVIRGRGRRPRHSDLHLVHGFDAARPALGPPFTLGHENSGWVHALLAQTLPGWRSVNPSPSVAPGAAAHPERCRLGIEAYCENRLATPRGQRGWRARDGRRRQGRADADRRSPPPHSPPRRSLPGVDRTADRRRPHALSHGAPVVSEAVAEQRGRQSSASAASGTWAYRSSRPPRLPTSSRSTPASRRSIWPRHAAPTTA